MATELIILVSGLCGLAHPQQAEEPRSAPDWMVQDRVVGEGHLATIGDRVTVHFVVQKPNGKAVADTGKRGLSFTFIVGDPAADEALSKAVLGMRSGGSRDISSEDRYMSIKLTNVIPSALMAKR